MGEQSMFKSELQSRQPEVEEAVKTMKRFAPPPAVEPHASTPPKTPLSATKQKSQSRLKLTHQGSVETLPKPPKLSERQQRTDKLAESWKSLWQDAQAYEERLKERKAYLEEMKRLEAFTFDEWRERYLMWNDHGWIS